MWDFWQLGHPFVPPPLPPSLQETASVTVKAGGAKPRPHALLSPCPPLASVLQPLGLEATGGWDGSVCEAAGSVWRVLSQSSPMPCAGSTGPSLLLTPSNGQAHPFVHWGNPVGYSSVPESRIWPLLSAQLSYLTRASSLTGSKATPLCPSSLLWPSVLLWHIFAQVGEARHGDMKAGEGVSAGAGLRGQVSGCPLPALSPLAVSRGQCCFPRCPVCAGPQAAGWSPA